MDPAEQIFGAAPRSSKSEQATANWLPQIIRAIGWWKKPRYHIVEISSRLQEVQGERLGSKAAWHASILEALEACGGAAVIISNELVDAFPCRVFKKQADGWRELALRIEGKVVVEEWIAAALPPSTVFSESWPVGQRVEVHESFRLWVREWLPVWKAGGMLTIDYGDTCPTLYRRHPRGTLRAYAHHQRLEGREVYGGFGLRDLTADVNFSDLQQEPALLTRAFGTLTEFISAAGGFSARIVGPNCSVRLAARGKPSSFSSKRADAPISCFRMAVCVGPSEPLRRQRQIHGVSACRARFVDGNI